MVQIEEMAKLVDSVATLVAAATGPAQSLSRVL